MNYLECLAYIDSLSPTLEKPTMERISHFLAEHSNPQNKYQVIHVGGTNGKGSIVAILDSIIRQTGCRVGRLTGPHLLRWNERFHIDDQPIDDLEFARLGSVVRQESEQFGREHPDLGPLTWFEYLTAIAFYWFADQKVDVAVVEVGLGGRFDATNVVENVLTSVITNVDLDHTHILGDTVAQIAHEKAGIIKPGVPVVTGATGDALAVIVEKCRQMQSSLYQCTSKNSDGALDDTPLLSRARRYYQSYKHLLALPGKYQQTNALVAVAAFLCSQLADRYTPEQIEQFIQKGFASVYWPGRLQQIPSRHLILDGAHNPAGAVALRSALDGLFPNSSFRFVISCFENKNATQFIEALVRSGDHVYFSEASARRAPYKKEELADYCSKNGIGATVSEIIATAFARAESERSGNEIIVATGSFATVRELMNALGWQTVEDGRPECVKISGSAKSDAPNLEGSI